jgi:hypothetical protein
MLCKKHHGGLFGREAEYERMFFAIVAENKRKSILTNKKLVQRRKITQNIRAELTQWRKNKKL